MNDFARAAGKSKTITTFFLMLMVASFARAQEQRPPAVPLVTHNPYFSIWSMADKLTDDVTRHWTGTPQPMTGMVRIDGKNYRYMGGPHEVPAMQQESLEVLATHTRYVFSGGGVKLEVSFFTPAFPQDVDLLSRPVTYLTWSASSMDGAPHKVEVMLAVSGAVAVNTDDQMETWGRSETSNLKVLNIGSQEQKVLGRSGDNVRIDWGYFHLAVPDDAAGATMAASADAVHSFVTTGALPASDDLDMPLPPNARAAWLAVEVPMQVSAGATETKHVLLSYTQEYEIEYMGRKERPYWQRDNKTVQQMLAEAESNYSALDDRGAKYDADLDKDLEGVGGVGYRELAMLAYRQTLAAHGLVAGLDGKPLMFEKENFSCGCIATVDVIYPASPYFLFFAPALLEAQLRPVLEYASLPGWTNPWAPHDLGRYPLADGHGEMAVGLPMGEEESMPVEESGNMLIMADALGHAQGDWHVAKQYWGLFTKWAEYLKEKGLDPENQLCTDDFAGKLAHNTNLSAKAIVALGAYSQMARGLGETKVADEYELAAKQMAVQWEQMARDGDHYKLAFDRSGTWSQKYNLVWDQMLGLNLFPPVVRKTEVAFYLKHLNEYGLPLDVRKDYTKTDWELWTATLAETPADFAALLDPIVKWTNETPSRVPLTDWYDTKTGLKSGFQARSVVGGVFIKALSDKKLAAKWQKMAAAQ